MRAWLVMAMLLAPLARALRSRAAGGRLSKLFATATQIEQCRVEFRGQTILVEKGELLRTALLRNRLTPHNGQAKLINCRGLGTCGTCAVRIDGPIEPLEKNSLENVRLSLPPHRAPENQSLRLACQCRIMGDLRVTKMAGFWGQYATVSEEPAEDFAIWFGELEYLLDPNAFRKARD